MKAYRLGFVMEQTLGHVTHDQNLRRAVEADASLEPTWIPVDWEAADLWQRLPLIGNNWTMRAGLRARRLVRNEMKRQRFDALLFHTQVTAMLAHSIMRQVPSVVSLDATPVNNAESGYGSTGATSSSPGVFDKLKLSRTAATFAAAARIVAWSEWAKQSVVNDYGIDAGKVTVLPPGVNLDLWSPSSQHAERRGPIRLLFVGGEFTRKGGHVLLRAMNELPDCELDVVSHGKFTTGPRLRVHRGLTPSSPELRALYAQADVFVLPSFGECLGIAMIEASACGLPVISTRVGAVHEVVEDGVTGMLIEPGNVTALVTAIKTMCADADKRRTMGLAGRQRAEERFDGRENYCRLVEIVKSCSEREPAQPPMSAEIERQGMV